MDEKNTDEEITIRRSKVFFLKRKEARVEEIAEQLHVSVPTINRDISWLKEESKKWIGIMAREGLVHEWHLGLEKLKDNAREINVMLNMKKDSDDPKSGYVYDGDIRIKLLKASDDNIDLQKQYLLDGPAVYIMNRHIEAGEKTYDP